MAFASYYKSDLHETLSPVTESGDLKSPTNVFQSMLVKFKHWRLDCETRRQLRKLPDYLLKDIGLTHYQVEHFKLRS